MESNISDYVIDELSEVFHFTEATDLDGKIGG